MSVFIIAEAGVNHNGSIDIAKKLIDVASDAGADAVKFQTFKAKDLVSNIAQKAEYQKKDVKKISDDLVNIHNISFDFAEKLKISTIDLSDTRNLTVEIPIWEEFGDNKKKKCWS